MLHVPPNPFHMSLDGRTNFKETTQFVELISIKPRQAQVLRNTKVFPGKKNPLKCLQLIDSHSINHPSNTQYNFNYMKRINYMLRK